MRRPGYNPTRRNRNLGTERQGHGQDNRLVIPEHWLRGPYWEQLGPHVVVPCAVHGRRLSVAVERTTPGCVHASTVTDVTAMLSLLPGEDLEGLGLVVLRQPTRKQATLSGVWGHLIYHYTLGDYDGPAVILEAVRVGDRMRWPRALDVEDQRELARLFEDGHAFTETRRHFELTLEADAARATQLFRTLPHEVGHWVHYRREVLSPGVDPSLDEHARREAYHDLPPRTREDFAHGYAERVVRALRDRGRVPFPLREDGALAARHGLSARDFAPPAGSR